MKARIPNTAPLKMPLNVPAGACVGLKGPSSHLFESSIHAASATKTAISKTPSTTPAPVERRTSRYVRKKTIAADTSTQIHHWPVYFQPTSLRITSVVAHAKIRNRSGATRGSKQRKIRPTRYPGTVPSARVTYAYRPPADGISFASWPIELATSMHATSANRTASGRAGPANWTEKRIENAIAAPGAMCVIDWKSTCGSPIERSRSWSNRALLASIATSLGRLGSPDGPRSYSQGGGL